ncbi:MAG TPA: glycosyltransferase family protein, partial [Ferruginibacter sp.]|nr:glycosyltransferase family protein [Ferruginibacter sp.]
PVNNDAFVESFINCTGILCGAGFETPAEALFLNKKLMVIPMKGQYEQQCNAAALQQMGVPVIKSLKLKHLEKIKAWTLSHSILSINFPDITEQVIDDIIAKNAASTSTPDIEIGKSIFSPKKLKEASLGKILMDTRI